jgi:hypothetical protein
MKKMMQTKLREESAPMKAKEGNDEERIHMRANS